MSRHVLDRPDDRLRRRAHRWLPCAVAVVASVAALVPSLTVATAASSDAAVAEVSPVRGSAPAVRPVGGDHGADGRTAVTRGGRDERGGHGDRAERLERVERRRATGLARVGDEWRTDLPGWTVVFEPRRGSALGLTEVDEQRIVVRLHPAARPARIARVIAHELGHAYDVTHLDTLARRAWKAARGLGDEVAWWPGAGAPDFDTGAGDFAECHATMLVGSVSRSTVAGPCTDADLALLRALSGTDG